MRLGEIEFPDDLLEARQDGHLVVFVGAGVSRPQPTGIPTFQGMADEIGGEAGVQQRRLEPLDVYLGRAAAAPYPVHDRVVEIINRGGGANVLHDAVMGLFKTANDVRVVTTNFDRHLWNSAARRWTDPPEDYVAPALPFGGDMRGIVYLHGAAHEAPADLVVTDRDFGLAYLTRGHATRFLIDLYSNNTVLFVGYSHSDAVLTYLARGLAPGTGKRYALAHARDTDRWRSLSVVPVEIPSRRGMRRHVPLARGLAAWGTYQGMGYADHQDRLAEVLRLGPSPDREAMDYVRARISDLDTVGFICREATDPGWLMWLAEEALFARVFEAAPADADAPIQRALSIWLAEHFVVQHLAEARRALVRLGGPLPLFLWNAIARVLSTNGPPARELSSWVAYLLAAAPLGAGELLAWCCGTLARSTTIRLRPPCSTVCPSQSRACRPPLYSPALPGSPSASRWRRGRSPEHYLNGARRSWPRVPAPSPGRCCGSSGATLAKANDLLRLSGQATDGHDPDSFRRSAVEPHAQDDRGQPEWSDPLVDAARGLLAWAWANDPGLAWALVETWVRARAALLRRLAVHAVGISPRMTPTGMGLPLRDSC